MATGFSGWQEEPFGEDLVIEISIGSALLFGLHRNQNLMDAVSPRYVRTLDLFK